MWAPRRCGCSLTGDMLRHSASHQERLDNPLGGAYVPRPIPLYRRQELDDSPLLQEMCVYDQGRARGQGGSNYSAPEAPDRNGGESLFAASIMAPATPFRFCVMQNSLTIEKTRLSRI